MFRRLHWFFGVVAAVTLLTWVSCVAARISDGDSVILPSKAASNTEALPGGISVSQHPPGQLPRGLTPGTAAVVMLVLSALACAAGIIGRLSRQVGDVGDDWRSLLLGAPPALA